MSAISLFQGDSSDLFRIRPNIADPAAEISDDWVCKTSLLSSNGEQVIAPRVESVKSDDGLVWLIGLSPEDTALVTVDPKFRYTQCTYVIEVSNSILEPAYRKEKHIRVNVKKQGIPNA